MDYEAFVRVVSLSSLTSQIIACAAFVLRIIVFWKIFEKAGEAGWKSLIPFYGDCIFFKIAWSKTWFLIDLFLIGSTFLLALIGHDSATMAVPYVFALSLIVNILVVIELGKNFDKKAGFIVGMLLLPVIFLPILAFDSSEYVREVHH